VYFILEGISAMPALRVRSFICLLSLLAGASAAVAQRSPYDAIRNQMVDEDIIGAAGVKNKRVIEAIRATPRHEFVPLGERKNAYYDMALPIGEHQTISPPSVVAYMTAALDPQPTDNVLEIGTGSGYQAAVLSQVVKEVYTVEIIAPLGRRAEKTLQSLHYDNVHVKIGDGYQGWPEHGPFDKIIVTCSPEKVPKALVEQLKEGGRMVIPVGERYQQTLYLLKKTDGKLAIEALQPTLFVPMTGTAEAKRKKLPDPANPTLENGNFESVTGDPPAPTGWHSQRQLKLVKGEDVPEGKNYVTFTNATPGRGSQALQGFAVDGRKAPVMEFSARVRGENIRPGPDGRPLAGAAIGFYDENRVMVGEVTLATWTGTFDWEVDRRAFNVPGRAREAILRIGLLGAVGEISFDDVALKAAR
jgi:protein-L-isoaspartate(D-aspartate) O-methyltransferase